MVEVVGKPPSVEDVTQAIRPLRDRLLIQVDPQERTRPSGLIVPATADRGSLRTGVILRMGPGRRNPETGKLIPMDERLFTGTRVVYLHFQAFESTPGARYGLQRADDADTCIIHEGDVLGIYDGPVGALRN